jgi:hypothetical protein
MKTTYLIIILALAAALALADHRHQSGTSGSGKASTEEIQMHSIAGQPAAGQTGDLHGGFLPVVELRNYEPGDANGDGNVNVSDAVYVLAYVFAAGPVPEPYSSADTDCNRVVNVSDTVFLINYVFGEGQPPVYCY